MYNNILLYYIIVLYYVIYIIYIYIYICVFVFVCVLKRSKVLTNKIPYQYTAQIARPKKHLIFRLKYTNFFLEINFSKLISYVLPASVNNNTNLLINYKSNIIIPFLMVKFLSNILP